MTDLVTLKQRVIDAEEKYIYAGMTNTYGKSAEELVAIDLAYRKSAHEYEVALAAYNNAIETEIGNRPISGAQGF